MDQKKKAGRYQRIQKQLEGLFPKSNNTNARLSTLVAVLHHKMDYYFWTGCYFLIDGELIVNQYQGPVACMELKKDVGVCWAAINRKETVVVEDVHAFPGHIACDSRSQSEIVVPIKNRKGEIIGVLDIDSKEKASFDQVDKEALEALVASVFQDY